MKAKRNCTTSGSNAGSITSRPKLALVQNNVIPLADAISRSRHDSKNRAYRHDLVKALETLVQYAKDGTITGFAYVAKYETKPGDAERHDCGGVGWYLDNMAAFAGATSKLARAAMDADSSRTD